MACAHCRYTGRVWVNGRGYVKCHCERPDPTYKKTTARNALASHAGKPETYAFGVAVRQAQAHFDVYEMARIARVSPDVIRKQMNGQMQLDASEEE